MPRIGLLCLTLLLASTEGRAQASPPVSTNGPIALPASLVRPATAADVARGAGRGAVAGAVVGGVIMPLMAGAPIRSDGDGDFFMRVLMAFTGAAVGALVGAGIAAAH